MEKYSDIVSGGLVDHERGKEDGESIPRSNIYPRLFAGEPYIINPTYLIVHEDECYGFNKWEPDIVIDGLVNQKRVGDKDKWYDEHFYDTVEVYDMDLEELLLRRILGSCLPSCPHQQLTKLWLWLGTGREL